MSCFKWYRDLFFYWPQKWLGMHDIYRTDKLSTNMGENDVIFFAPINKWNPISRSDKLRLLINQSINQSDLSEIHPLSECNDSQLVSHSFHHHLWTCLCQSGSFSARITRGKKASSFNTTNLISHLKGRHRGEAVLKDFKQPPLL